MFIFNVHTCYMYNFWIFWFHNSPVLYRLIFSYIIQKQQQYPNHTWAAWNGRCLRKQVTLIYRCGFQAPLRECQAMRSYINEGALKPKSIPLQIPNCSVAEFGGWEFSAQKETNILSPNAKADDVLRSLFMDPRRWTFLPVQDTSHDDDTRYTKLKLFSTFRKRDISSEHNISSGWQFIKEVISSGGGSDERFSSLHGFHRRR